VRVVNLTIPSAQKLTFAASNSLAAQVIISLPLLQELFPPNLRTS